MTPDSDLGAKLRRLGEAVAPAPGFADRVAAGVACLPRPASRRLRRVLARVALAAALVVAAVTLAVVEARRGQPTDATGAVADAGGARPGHGFASDAAAGPTDKPGDKSVQPGAPGVFFSMTAFAYVNSKWGFIDRTGKVVIPAKYSAVGEFSEGLAPVQVDGTHFHSGKWGYVNRNGQEVIPPQFGGAMPFHEGLAGVKVGEKWGFVDRSGRVVVPPRFDFFVDWFTAGLAAVREDGKWGFIGPDGHYRIPAQFNYVTRFSEGLAAVQVGATDKFGYIDPSGRYVIEPRFDSAAQFHEDRAGVVAGGVRSLIDRTGTVVCQTKYDSFSQVWFGEFKNGRARVNLTKRLMGGKNNGLSVDWFAYVDPDGREIVPPTPRLRLTIDPTTGNLSALEVDDQGDEKAAAVDLDRAFEQGGLFRVSVSHQVGNVGYHTYGFADGSKRIVIPPTLEDVKEFHEGLAAFATGLDWKAVGEAFKRQGSGFAW